MPCVLHFVCPSTAAQFALLTVAMPTSSTDSEDTVTRKVMDKKNQLDVTFCILYFSSNSYSTCFGQPCAHHQELTTA